MKILKFPKDKMKYPRWRLWLKNIDKQLLLNRIISGFSLSLAAAIILFAVYVLNKP